MPTASDLVTDLPADFEVFGQAVDTSLADLKGGTTGQVLAKASNTNMDFTWVTTDDANAIQNSIVDAKGDIVAASANDTPARLAVGNNGETLVADSSTSTGLRYQAPVQQNPVLNSAFQVWQRGTSFVGAAGGSYTADRWYSYRGASATGYTTSRQVTGDTTNLPNIQYCARLQRDSGNTSTAIMAFTQSFETVNSIPFAGKTVTFSFYARKGANFSPTSSQFEASIYYGTGTDQAVFNGYTGVGYIGINSLVATTTWQRFTYTGTIPATATEISPYFTFNPTGTAGAADYLEITGVKLEVGSVATPFNTYAATIQGELAACQRYFYRVSGTGYAYFSNASARSTTVTDGTVALPVSMRVVPSLAFSAGNTFMVYENGAIVAGTAISSDSATLNSSGITLTVASGLVARGAGNIRANNTLAFIEFSSEL